MCILIVIYRTENVCIFKNDHDPYAYITIRFYQIYAANCYINISVPGNTMICTVSVKIKSSASRVVLLGAEPEHV